MLKRHPELPKFVEGGSPKNPLGPRALYLHRDGADTGYRFHGTIQPWSIGTDASSGCIRMFNEDAIDLYQRCPIGTAVQVLQHIADQAEKSRALPDTDDDGRTMKKASTTTRAGLARGLFVAASLLALAACSTTKMEVAGAPEVNPNESGATGDPAAGFENVRPGSRFRQLTVVSCIQKVGTRWFFQSASCHRILAFRLWVRPKRIERNKRDQGVVKWGY